jgi:uncharacterized protein
VTGRRIPHPVAVVVLVVVISACGTSTPAHFYTLDSTAIAEGSPPERTTVMIAPISVPAAVDQPQMVVQVGPNRVEMEEFNRWAAPLNDQIARAVAGDLVVLLGTPDVTTTPLADFSPAYWVTINVQRFDSVQGEAAVVEAVWAVRRTAGGETQSGRTVAREAVQGDGFEALASAHSRALAKLSGDIAGAIRTEAGEQP